MGAASEAPSRLLPGTPPRLCASSSAPCPASSLPQFVRSSLSGSFPLVDILIHVLSSGKHHACSVSVVCQHHAVNTYLC